MTVPAALQRSIERLARQRPAPATAAAIGLAAATLAAAMRFGLYPWLDGTPALPTIYPALLAAALWGGRLAGLAALTGAAAFSLLLLDPAGYGPERLGGVVSVVTSGAVTVALGLLLKHALRTAAEARDAQAVLAHELRHRVKNNLAVLQALAVQTARTSTDVPSFLQAFDRRLAALADAQDLVIAAGLLGVPLEALARAAVRPFVDGSTFSVTGPAARLAPDDAVSLALCLHELGTNATKHGALARPEGRVAVAWAPADARTGQLQITWTETGGPPPARESRRGFGARLLERGVGGRGAVLRHDRGGLVWQAVIPASG